MYQIELGLSRTLANRMGIVTDKDRAMAFSKT